MRLLASLEQLLEISSSDLEGALTHACDIVAAALRADKVDAFLHDPAKDTLVALGTSRQPLSALQKRTGLDVLPVANGGRVVHVFLTGETFMTGDLQNDPEELRGVKETLKIQSKLGVPLHVAGKRRGMMMIASLRPGFFSDDDVRFAGSVVRWVGTIAHRAELIEQIARDAVEEGRRAVAEELITVLAHDLRNFLAPISTRLQLLRRRAASAGREPDLRDLELALRGVGRLDRMINDILDVARLDQGVFRIQPEPIDLAALVEDVASTLSTAEQPVRVHAPESVVVAADDQRLRQCLENVITNAQQHSPRAVPVSVTVARTLTEGGPFGLVEIRDEGPGIPTEILPRLFERFATQGRSKGLGLGLYLAARIAAAHGGQLQAESAVGNGAHFALRLPCGPGTSSPPTGTPPGGSPAPSA
jgi:two-component system, OmpR family, sensor kinase